LRGSVVDLLCDGDIRVSDAPPVWVEAFDDEILLFANLGTDSFEVFERVDGYRLNPLCESRSNEIPPGDVLENCGHVREALGRVRVIRVEEFFENRDRKSVV